MSQTNISSERKSNDIARVLTAALKKYVHAHQKSKKKRPAPKKPITKTPKKKKKVASSIKAASSSKHNSSQSKASNGHPTEISIQLKVNTGTVSYTGHVSLSSGRSHPATSPSVLLRPEPLKSVVVQQTQKM